MRVTCLLLTICLIPLATPVFSAPGAADAEDVDLAKFPSNTWVELKYSTEQPSEDLDEQGRLLPAGWNKLVYDPDGRRVLF